MALMDLIGGVVEGIGLNDIVGDFFGDSLSGFLGGEMGSFATDILSGAITNAAIAGIAGGDIGKAALFGAAGGGLSGDMLGGWGNEIGGAVSGYGLAESMDGNGLLGAAAGGLGAYANERFGGDEDFKTRKESGDIEAATQDESVAVDPSMQNPAPAAGGRPREGRISARLREMGLINESGEGTMLGKALVAGIGSMSEQKSTEDLMDKQLDHKKDLDKYQSDLDHEAEQKRISAFTSKKPTFKVVRNG